MSDKDEDEDEDDVEADRLRALVEWRRNDRERGGNQSLESRYAPKTFGCHEALHVTHLIVELIQRELLDHGAIILNAEWYARVRKAQDELGAVYQSIGAALPSGTSSRH